MNCQYATRPMCVIICIALALIEFEKEKKKKKEVRQLALVRHF